MKAKRRWLFFIPVLLGILAFIIIARKTKEPNRPQISEMSRSVSVVQVKQTTIVPRVKGYGYVEPTETWEAVPEVSGRVVEMHPELKKGVFLKKGDVLLRLDPQSYDFAESRGRASVMSVEAQLRELAQQRENTERLLEIEQKALALARKEMTRKRDLHQQGFLSQSELEQEEKMLLSQETAIKNLVNTLALIPSQEKALLAKKDSDVSSLGAMRLDLERTVIRAPFDCRIAEVNVELDEYAAVGTVLVRAIGIAAVEIPVKIAPGEFANLLPNSVNSSIIMEDGIDMERIREMIGVKATVRLPMFHRDAVWEGEFRRTGESVDVATGALTVYVAVEQPYASMQPGVRPPLVPNLYCEVELQGHLWEDRYLLPMRALHNGRIYLVDSDGRLAFREIEVELAMDDFAVVSAGLTEGEMVVLTDLIPAIEGMLLEPHVDTNLEQQIAIFAGAN